jgi:hypothetical protein
MNVEINNSESPDQIQVGGSHYTSLSIQPWEYMQSLMTPEEFEGYLRGNVIKYISRYPEKAGLQDLQKAQHYLAKLIATISQ